ncbi:MAG: sulfite exporter TauE/SafE family protein [Elusimicrobiota bacterium]
MSVPIAEGFVLGLSTGPYCLTSCAPLFFPYMLADGREGWKAHVLFFCELLAGRLAAYLLFGLLAGTAGAFFPAARSPKIMSGALLCSGALLLCVPAFKVFPSGPARLCGWALRSRAVRRMPFALGFLAGINLCPPFAAGLVRVLELGGAWAGAGYFTAFFLGTSLYLLPLLVSFPLAAHQRVKDIGLILCCLMGLWFCGLGLAGLLKI